MRKFLGTETQSPVCQPLKTVREDSNSPTRTKRVLETIKESSYTLECGSAELLETKKNRLRQQMTKDNSGSKTTPLKQSFRVSALKISISSSSQGSVTEAKEHADDYSPDISAHSKALTENKARELDQPNPLNIKRRFKAFCSTDDFDLKSPCCHVSSSDSKSSVHQQPNLRLNQVNSTSKKHRSHDSVDDFICELVQADDF
mmetsp:Transcript_34408/g.45283  ORF Transcript_34408/g.45283 Transcript_34408/m.45283 type:complete len:202 (+) Transcript_34408:809-1414(+)